MTKLTIPALALMLLLISISANATPLLPGTTVVPSIAPTFGTPGGETLLATNIGVGTGGTSFWWSAVYRGGAGALCPTCLSFYYQVQNNSNLPFYRETNFSFDGNATEVFITPVPFDIFTPGSQIPSSADRDATGNTVGFDFGSPGVSSLSGSPNLDPTETSFVTIIRTNATAFTPGASSVFAVDLGPAALDAPPYSSFQTFAPVAAPAVPEPSSILTMMVGAIALIGFSVRKK